jgi:hypothetical protein
MKKILLCISLLIGGVNLSFSQCTPDSQYADSTWGFWPNLVDGLPPAEVGVFYLQVIDFKIPTNASVIDPLYPYPIVSAVLDSIVGLPSGINSECNLTDCFYGGGDQGCASLSGISSDPSGVYPLTIYLTITVNFFVDIPVAYEITDYSLTLNPAVGVSELSKQKFTVEQNSPNPSRDISKIKYTLPTNTSVEVSLYDLVGKKVKSEKFFAEKGNREYVLNTSNMDAGIYMYSIKAYDKVITKRMNVIK